MAYTYSKLKEAIFGRGSNGKPLEEFTGNDSPNNIRCIVLGYNFIFVAFHTNKGCRIISLDINAVNEDLMKNGRNAGLHNVLSKVQLSCLEELYIDSVYKRGEFSGCFDMQKYISGLVNSKCRLRFYGYCQNEDSYWLKARYEKAKSEQDFTYSLAKDKERAQSGMVIDAEQVDNSDWYKKYNLRYNDYPMDKQGGQLDRYFSSIKGKIEKHVQDEINEIKTRGFAACISGLYNQDLANKDGIIQWKLLGNVSKKLASSREGSGSAPDIIITIRSHVFNKFYKNEEKSFSLKVNSQEMVNLLRESKCEKDDQLISLYQRDFKTFTGNTPKLNRDNEKIVEMLSSRLENFEGISGLKSYYTKAMIELADTCMNEKNYNKIILIGAIRDLGIPEYKGKQPREVFQEISKRKDWLALFNNILMYMMGFNNIKQVRVYSSSVEV